MYLCGTILTSRRLFNFFCSIGLYCFFSDDFTFVCSEGEEENATFCTEALVRMLGFWFADSGDEALPSAPKFRTLSLLISVVNLRKGAFTVEHTESRTTGVSRTLTDLLARDTCGTEELERLHGRSIWYDSFCFGRLLNSPVGSLSKFLMQLAIGSAGMPLAIHFATTFGQCFNCRAGPIFP